MKSSLVLFVTILLAGCATMPYQPYAREVKKKPRAGGVIALKSEHRPEDRARADFLMSANCGTDATVNVSEEGEVAVGEKTNSSSSKKNETGYGSGFKIGGLDFTSGPRPEENTDVQSETVKLKEWQIAYECVAMAPVPARGKKPVSHN